LLSITCIEIKWVFVCLCLNVKHFLCKIFSYLLLSNACVFFCSETEKIKIPDIVKKPKDEEKPERYYMKLWSVFLWSIILPDNSQLNYYPTVEGYEFDIVHMDACMSFSLVSVWHTLTGA
jgi:hypothetical protein